MNPNIKRAIASVLLFIAGAIYTYAMVWFSAAFAGAGHGTSFFIGLVAGPNGIFLAIWPVIGALLPWRRTRWAATTLISFSLVPVIWALYLHYHLGDDEPYFNKVWRQLHSLAQTFLVFFALPTIVSLCFGLWSLMPKSKNAAQN